MSRELIATIGKDERNLVVEQLEDGRFRVSIDGEERVVDAAEVTPGTWSLIIDGRSLLVHADPTKRAMQLQCEGTSAQVQVEDARRKRLAKVAGVGHGGDAKGEIVRAPIAGKVVKLLVAEGDEVAAGAGVCVLEAMKMENEITAERGGTVEAIHVSAGDPVETNDKLLTLG